MLRQAQQDKRFSSVLFRYKEGLKGLQNRFNPSFLFTPMLVVKGRIQQVAHGAARIGGALDEA